MSDNIISIDDFNNTYTTDDGAVYDASTGALISGPFTGTNSTFSSGDSSVDSSLFSAQTVNQLTDLAKTLVTTYSSIQLNQLNIERAKRGLSPLNTSAYSPQVNVGLSPDIKQYLLIGGIALAGILLINKKR